MLSGQDLEPAVRRRIEAISAEAARATTLISTLQAYARADRDMSPSVDLSAVVDRAVGLRVAALRRERIVLNVDVASRRNALVPGPSTRLLQIVLDVLLEAERVLKGTTTPVIAVRVESLAGTVVVRVNASANDLAIDDASSTERSGLLTADAQLWAASRLAERAGGTVTVVSAAGSCEWTLTVPAAAPASIS